MQYVESQPLHRRPSPSYILAVLRLNLMSAMAYRLSFLSQVVFMMLNNAIFLSFWWILFERFGNVRGWQMGDVIVLFGVSASGFGLSTSLFGNAWRLSEKIQQGQIDYYLALPPAPLLHVLITRMSLAGMGDLLFGVLVYCIFVPFELSQFLLFLFMVVVAASVLTSFCVLVHSLTFFTGGAEGVARFLSQALLTFSLYPSSLFSGGTKILLYTIIPAGFVSHLPVALLKEFSWGTLAVLLAFTAGLVWLARTVFYAGLRRYGSGNLIAGRM